MPDVTNAQIEGLRRFAADRTPEEQQALIEILQSAPGTAAPGTHPADDLTPATPFRSRPAPELSEVLEPPHGRRLRDEPVAPPPEIVQTRPPQVDADALPVYADRIRCPHHVDVLGGFCALRRNSLCPCLGLCEVGLILLRKPA